MTSLGLLVASGRPGPPLAGCNHARISPGILPPHVTFSCLGLSLWVSKLLHLRRTQTQDQGPPQPSGGSSALSYTCRGPVSKKGHIPRCQDVNAFSGGSPFILQPRRHPTHHRNGVPFPRWTNPDLTWLHLCLPVPRVCVCVCLL